VKTSDRARVVEFAAGASSSRKARENSARAGEAGANSRGFARKITVASPLLKFFPKRVDSTGAGNGKVRGLFTQNQNNSRKK
jgi:hypothetical protein